MTISSVCFHVVELRPGIYLNIPIVFFTDATDVYSHEFTKLATYPHFSVFEERLHSPFLFIAS
jgi:cytochrome c oxidase assembly protein Cox11